MENLRETLMLLCDLQEKDIKIETLKNKLEDLPKFAEHKKQQLSTAKKEFDNRKETYVKLNSLKKEKESLLVSKESLIAKYTTDLNNVKSNDVYKSCLLEIEKAKADKSVIEDEILQLMEDIDKETVNLKQYEADLKKAESEINGEIKNIEDSSLNMRQEIEKMKTERDSFSKSININILSQYERIRENRNGIGLSLVDGDSCGACNMVIRPQLINQATKCKELVYCDNCSRILFNKKEVV
ncbi:MAG: C4-type zinc ribbon domain-containing protein [Endomicrobiaceae bacterium]|jgi:predicted  nucleic acid-binding Zn-ribbon protein|nr:C4-type zinc ribbon domain-containing protein [Endomicrobiaceae bacterium]